MNDKLFIDKMLFKKQKEIGLLKKEKLELCISSNTAR